MTNFDKDIETITSFFQQYHFHIAESYKNFVKYESAHAEVSVGYDERDCNYFTLIGNKIDNSISLDVINLRDVFAYDIEIFTKKSFVDFFLRSNVSQRGRCVFVTGIMNQYTQCQARAETLLRNKDLFI